LSAALHAPIAHRRSAIANVSGFRFGFAETQDAVAWIPLIALFEQGDAFKAFEHVAFCAGRSGGAQTPMLRHKILKWFLKAVAARVSSGPAFYQYGR